MNASVHPFAPDAPQETAREAPHNMEAEQALLGALLTRNESFDSVASFLRGDHFFEAIHGKIFEAIALSVQQGRRASPVTLKAYFDNDPALSEVGGASYLVRLAGAAVSTRHVEDYGNAVLDCFLRRQLIGLGERMVGMAYDPQIDVSPAKQMEAHAAEIDGYRGIGEPGTGFHDHRELLHAAVAQIEQHGKPEAPGIPSGLKALDEIMMPLRPGNMVIVAGRSSMGKSALCQFLALRAAERGVPVAYFSLGDMSALEVADRELAIASGIGLDRLGRGKMHTEEWSRLIAAAAERGSLPFHVDATPRLTAAQIRMRALKLRRRHGLGLVVIDYLQMVRAQERYRDNKVAEVAEVSAEIKGMLAELQIPGLIACQLNREADKRTDKRPELSDLRWSGDIEQDADKALLLYRRHYYERTSTDPYAIDKRTGRTWEDDRNTLEIILAKQRMGPTGTAHVRYELATGRFDDLGGPHRHDDRQSDLGLPGHITDNPPPPEPF